MKKTNYFKQKLKGGVNMEYESYGKMCYIKNLNGSL